MNRYHKQSLELHTTVMINDTTTFEVLLDSPIEHHLGQDVKCSGAKDVNIHQTLPYLCKSPAKGRHVQQPGYY